MTRCSERLKFGDEVVEWLSFQEWHQSEWRRDTTGGRVKWLSGWAFKNKNRENEGERLDFGIWSGWVVDLIRVISEREGGEKDYSWEMKWLSGWAFKSDIRVSEGDRAHLGDEVVEWLSFQDFKRKNRERVRERHQIWDIKWLSGWAFINDIRVSEGDRPHLGDEVVEWLSFHEWCQSELRR